MEILLSGNMQYFISYFQQIRNINDSSYIFLDTSYFAPKWLDPSNGTKQYINEYNQLIGIKLDELLLSEDEIPEEMCSGQPCPYIDKHPHCQFLEAYYKHLQKIGFNKLLQEINRIAEDVRKITHYEGEPKIVLLVHEKPDNPCSERGPLIRFFKENGIILREWSKEDLGMVF